MEEQEESVETEMSVHDIASDNCLCPECDKNYKRYIQIIDVDNYINALNDWD